MDMSHRSNLLRFDGVVRVAKKTNHYLQHAENLSKQLDAGS